MADGQKTKVSMANRAAALLLLLVLAWLTVCLPVVYQAQQTDHPAAQAAEADTDNPLSSTNEEKSEAGTNTLTEYLQHTVPLEPNLFSVVLKYKRPPAASCPAPPSQRFSPPPEA